MAEGAAAGLLCSYNLDGFNWTISHIMNRSGYEALTKQQQYCHAVFMCDAEINNGGLSQYFLNSSGDHWRDAVAGFKVMGFKERLEILEESIALFGKSGPSTSQDARQDERNKLESRNKSVFRRLESRYYKSSEVVDVFIARFVLANPDDFKPN